MLLRGPSSPQMDWIIFCFFWGPFSSPGSISGQGRHWPPTRGLGFWRALNQAAFRGDSCWLAECSRWLHLGESACRAGVVMASVREFILGPSGSSPGRDRSLQRHTHPIFFRVPYSANGRGPLVHPAYSSSFNSAQVLSVRYKWVRKRPDEPE